jgi:peptidylprolyl isomerase
MVWLRVSFHYKQRDFIDIKSLSGKDKKEQGMSQAKKGDSVKIHYTGTLADGTVFDSSAGRDPLGFTLGSGQVIVGFDEAVLGMAIGEKKTVTIPSHKAYGEKNEELVIEVPRSQVPPDLNPEVDQKLQMGGPNGELVVVTVVAVNDEVVVLDANPPLAGKDLTFALELVAIS